MSYDIYLIPEIKNIITNYKLDLEYTEYYDNLKKNMFSELMFCIFLKKYKHINNIIYFKSKIPNKIHLFIHLINDDILKQFANYGLKRLLYDKNIFLTTTELLTYLRGYLIINFNNIQKNRDYIIINVPHFIDYLEFFVFDISEFLAE